MISCIGIGLECSGLFGLITKTLKAVVGPKYDGEYLYQVVREKLGEIRLHETLTNVVIPTFDIKNLQPTVFSTYEVLIPIPFDSCLSKHQY